MESEYYRYSQPGRAPHIHFLVEYNKYTAPHLKIAVGLHVSTDLLLFEENERAPGDDLAFQLEAISQMPEGKQMVIREVLESLIIKYQSRRWDSGRQAAKR